VARLSPGTPLSPAALAALRDARIEPGFVRLTVQLARADYEQTDAVLSRLGGQRMVANSGRLVAIVPSSLAHRTDRRTRTLRALVERYGEWWELPAGAFQASGTGVRTFVVVMDRPATVPLDPPPLVLAVPRTNGGRQLSLFDGSPR
jgi:hypothetical protein